jgi:hypothetical protein
VPVSIGIEQLSQGCFSVFIITSRRSRGAERDCGDP